MTGCLGCSSSSHRSGTLSQLASSVVSSASSRSLLRTAHAELLRNVAPDKVLRLITARGTLVELLKCLEHTTPAFTAELIEALDAPAVERLLARTVEEGRSIGTLNLALRALGRRDKEQRQLAALEGKLGVDRLLRLITARGTLVQLLKCLEHTTPAFTAELIEALDAPAVERLLARTVKEGRSIGTLNLALRALGRRDTEQRQLAALEGKLGVDRLLRLITARGTLVELLKCLANTTPAFTAELIGALDAPTVERLLASTVEERRSIRTLDLALLALGRRDKEQRQLAALEGKLGADRLLRLITARGTLVQLLKCLEHTTPAFTAELIEALDAPAVERLLARTVKEGRSIGTLNLALRALGRRDTEQRQLVALEGKLGAERLLRLIAARGTLPELLRLLKETTPAFTAELIEALDAPTVERLLARTVEEGKSIGTLNLALSRLWRVVPEQARRLEALVGVTGWWRLLSGAGDLDSFCYLLKGLSQDVGTKLLSTEEAQSTQEWSALARRGNFYSLCRFAVDVMPRLPPTTRKCFTRAVEETVEDIVEATDWAALNSGLAAAARIKDQVFRELLQVAAVARVAATDIERLRFDDLGDAVSALTCLWRLRPESCAAN